MDTHWILTQSVKAHFLVSPGQAEAHINEHNGSEPEEWGCDPQVLWGCIQAWVLPIATFPGVRKKVKIMKKREIIKNKLFRK